MRSQIALNSQLENPFELFEFKDGVNSSNFDPIELSKSFEAGKVLLIEGLVPESLEYFLNLKTKVFDEWRPPVFDSKIIKEVDEQHVLKEYYQTDEEILAFQKEMVIFQKSWEKIFLSMFPNYDFVNLMYSWRMNELNLGFLHFDIPEYDFPEHQIRNFINLSERPRIIEFGPTIDELVKKYFHEEDLQQYFDLPYDKFVEAIKVNVLKKHNGEDLILPRHYMTLAPGAMWVSNAFVITHGVVYGEKTVCLEGRISPSSLMDKDNDFIHRVERIKKEPLSSHVSDIKLFT